MWARHELNFKSCSRCVGIDCSGRDSMKLLVVATPQCGGPSVFTKGASYRCGSGGVSVFLEIDTIVV